MKSITGEGSELPALEPWKDDPETEADRHLAARLNLEFNGSEYEASVRFSRDMVHARRMLLEACAISRRLSEEIVTLRAALSSTQRESAEADIAAAWFGFKMALPPEPIGPNPLAQFGYQR